MYVAHGIEKTSPLTLRQCQIYSSYSRDAFRICFLEHQVPGAKPFFRLSGKLTEESCNNFRKLILEKLTVAVDEITVEGSIESLDIMLECPGVPGYCLAVAQRNNSLQWLGTDRQMEGMRPSVLVIKDLSDTLKSFNTHLVSHCMKWAERQGMLYEAVAALASTEAAAVRELLSLIAQFSLARDAIGEEVPLMVASQFRNIINITLAETQLSLVDHFKTVTQAGGAQHWQAASATVLVLCDQISQMTVEDRFLALWQPWNADPAHATWGSLCVLLAHFHDYERRIGHAPLKPCGLCVRCFFGTVESSKEEDPSEWLRGPACRRRGSGSTDASGCSSF
ncbi:hypothetical protein NKR23_g11792 [Pleurostoma richardsiae]|uniref:Uncharacterized protein n=1 Tax=Pleurostoma richardsiae TaxID=41990 RepID=A0AA38RIB4_9PEZI|nr:hypothetical protein NKR23_g11792 [Pleurostoma richardsiae]